MARGKRSSFSSGSSGCGAVACSSTSRSRSSNSSSSIGRSSRGGSCVLFSVRFMVVAVMAEHLTLLVTCLVVLGNEAFTVPGLAQSGSQLIDNWNLFPREPGCHPLHPNYGRLCARFSYNTTARSGSSGFNFLHHQSQAEANAQLSSYGRLLETRCSDDLLFLLCSYHFPICSEHLQEPITPCRGLCSRVQEQCEPLLRMANVSWPETINCSHLLPESRLTGGQRMHVCVETTTALIQATGATPSNPEEPRPGPQRSACVATPPRCQNGGTCRESGDQATCACTEQFTGVTCETLIPPPPPRPPTCPACKTNTLKKKTFKKGKFTWVVSGIVASKPSVKGKRVCHQVNITESFFSDCNNSVTPTVGESATVCVLRAHPTCTPCTKGFTRGKELILGGKMIKSSRLLVDLNDWPLFSPHKAQPAKKVRKWLKKENKSKKC